MISTILFFLFFAAILSICFCFPSNNSHSYTKICELPSQFKYKLGDYWELNTQLKNLPPGGQATVFVTYQSDTLGKSNSTEYTNIHSVAVRNNLTYDRVLVEVEVWMKDGLCTKQRILEGYIATSQHWTSKSETSTVFLGTASCSGEDLQSFSVTIDFKGECNDNLLFGLINWRSQCKIGRRWRNATDISGTSHETGASNTTAITEKIPELITTCFNEENSGISTSSSLKILVLLFGITFTI